MLEVGAGASDCAVFGGLISGGVLPGTELVGPLSRRFLPDALIGTGRFVPVLGMAAFIPGGVWAWWGGVAVFGTGLGLLEVACITRVQGMLPDEVRGRVIGLGINALALGAVLAAQPLPTPALMLGPTVACILLGLLWPLARRAEERRHPLPHSAVTR